MHYYFVHVNAVFLEHEHGDAFLYFKRKTHYLKYQLVQTTFESGCQGDGNTRNVPFQSSFFHENYLNSDLNNS